MKTSGFTASVEDPHVASRQIFNLITPELALVEAEFERQARSNIQVISYLGDYLREAGGKRVRPALTILSNYAAGGESVSQNIIRMATVMEFLHTATLVHDDIIDNADKRRNRPSINSRFGNQTAVLMGDWLYMSAFETSLAERSLEVLDILTRVTRKMTEGELVQLTLIGRSDITEDQYLDILERKTAFLFSACCEIGGILGGGSEDECRALRDYGMFLGTAFQLVDDLLDFTTMGEGLGKAAGADLLEGKVTLPLIYLVEAEPDLRRSLQSIMRSGNYEEVSRQSLMGAVERTGALARAKARAAEYADNARTALTCLRNSAYKEALHSIPNYIIERDC